MLGIPGTSRLFLYQDPVNMKKSFEGLSGLVEKLFPGELLSGSFFIFVNRRGDQIKILFWDRDGFVIWTKRLETGAFLMREMKTGMLDRRGFMMLLEGVTPKRLNKRFSIE